MAQDKSQIRILHIISGLSVGGAETALYRLLRGLDRNSFINEVVSLRGKGAVGEQIEDIGVNVHELGIAGASTIFKIPLRLKRIVREFEPNIIHSWMYHANLVGLYAARKAKDSALLWSIRCSNMDMSKYGVLSGFAVRAGSSMSGKPDAIIVNSVAGKEYHKSIGYKPRKWIHISNGFDVESFAKASDDRMREQWGVKKDEFLIGMVGRIDPMKDYDTFLKAAASLSGGSNKVKYVCVGDGPEDQKKRLMALAETLGLSDKVIWAGWVKDMVAVYSTLDMFTLSSLSEGFSNALGEAMAAGVPCVATDVGDSRAIVGDAGVVVAPGDVGALASAWKSVLSMKDDVRVEMGSRAMERIRDRYAIDKMVSDYESVYHNLSSEADLVKP